MRKATTGQPVSIYADERTVRVAESLALAENRKVAQLGGEALSLWVDLPESARAAVRYIRGLGDDADVQAAYREVTRALLGVQQALVSERVTEELRAQFTGLDPSVTEDEITSRAVRLTRDPKEPSPRDWVEPPSGRAARRRGRARVQK